MSKSMRKVIMLAALVMSIGLAGCASTSTVSELTDRVSALESAVAAAQSTANDASSMAQSAQNTANQAMEAANSAQACCDANSERIGRVFEKTSYK